MPYNVCRTKERFSMTPILRGTNQAFPFHISSDSIDKFKHKITGYSNFFHTDDSTIKYLMNKPITNARVTRWLLILQEFDISIVDRPGEENVVAEFISQLSLNDDNLLVEESFLD